MRRVADPESAEADEGRRSLFGARIFENFLRADGETGRRASLRSSWGNPWGFESLSAQFLNWRFRDSKRAAFIDATTRSVDAASGRPEADTSEASDAKGAESLSAQVFTEELEF